MKIRIWILISRIICLKKYLETRYKSDISRTFIRDCRDLLLVFWDTFAWTININEMLNMRNQVRINGYSIAINIGEIFRPAAKIFPKLRHLRFGKRITRAYIRAAAAARRLLSRELLLWTGEDSTRSCRGKNTICPIIYASTRCAYFSSSIVYVEGELSRLHLQYTYFNYNYCDLYFLADKCPVMN